MFEDKTVLLLGATGGIGSALAQKISKLGGNLILGARNENKLLQLQQNLPNKSIICSIDATKFDELKKIVALGIETFGSIDILIHSVGSIVLKPIHALSEEDFRETLELNLVSAFLSIKSVIRKMMKQKHGSIVVISSVAGSTGLANHEAISAAKGGLEAMIRSASLSYAKRGIRFNAVALGLVDTSLSKSLTSNELALESSIKLHPLGRIGQPDDIVDAVLYLASSNSSWTTGTIIHVDGGIAAGK